MYWQPPAVQIWLTQPCWDLDDWTSPSTVPLLTASVNLYSVTSTYYAVILTPLNWSTLCTHFLNRTNIIFLLLSQNCFSCVTFPGGSRRDPEGSECGCPAGSWCGPGAAGSSDRAVHRGRPEGPALQCTAGGHPQQLEQWHTACKYFIFSQGHRRWLYFCVEMGLALGHNTTGRQGVHW